jgi:hypothetical protein
MERDDERLRKIRSDLSHALELLSWHGDFDGDDAILLRAENLIGGALSNMARLRFARDRRGHVASGGG